MTTPFYRRLLARSWQISWRHKHLWIFGFFATFAGFGGVSEIFVRAFRWIIDLVPAATLFGWPLAFFPSATVWKAMITYSPFPLLTAIIFSVLTALTLVVFVWIIIVSIAALVRSCDRLGRGAGDIHFNECFRLGLPRFWPIFAINFAAKLVTLLAAAFTGVSLFILVGEGNWTSAIFYIASFVIFIALAVLVSVISIFATMESAMNGLDPIAAICRGAALLAKNWMVGLETAVIVLGANLAFGFLVLAGMAVLSIPIVFLFLVVAAIGSRLAIISLMIGAMILIILLAVAFGSFMTTFQTAFWTLVWQEISGRKHLPWTVRIFAWLPERFHKK